MHRQDLRPATRKASEDKRSKLATRLSKGEKRNRKRMATVAERLFGGPPRAHPREMPPCCRGRRKLSRSPRRVPVRSTSGCGRPAAGATGGLAGGVPRSRRSRPAAYQDLGCRGRRQPQLHLLAELAAHHGVQLTIVLDLFHVLGYLWKAGHAVAVEGSKELEQWVLQRLGRVLQGRARWVAAGIRRSATKRHLSARQREPLDRCANYLLKYQRYLAYDQYLADGLPIGSGVIEGACRHLVKDRLARTGARWRLRGAEAVLRLRALRSSGDFDEYWRFRGAGVRAYPPAALRRRTGAVLRPRNGPHLRLLRSA